MLHTNADSTVPAHEPKPRAFAAGFALVWTRQHILWWIFAVNLILAFLGVHSTAHSATQGLLNQSLESSRRLYHGFDISAFDELASLPEQPLRGMTSMPVVPSLLFSVFMLFVTGGLLASYYNNLALDTADFFAACGRNFWAFVRLMVYFAIAMIPIAIIGSIAGKIYDRIDERAISPFSAPVFMAMALLVILFLVLCVRLWFDVAQVIAVVNDERTMHLALRRSAVLVWGNFVYLFWLYVRISVIGWAVFFLGLCVWMMVLRPESTGTAFVVGQIMILVWLGTRLWQRASETTWYKQYSASQHAAAPVPPAPAPVDLPRSEILPETD